MTERASRNTVARQWHLLRSLPSRPPGATARELTAKLAEKGFRTSKRTVERDLAELAVPFPIQCNGKGRPYGWHWMRNATFDIPGIELTEALSLTLVEDFLRQMLPLSHWRSLRPRLDYARKNLTALAGRNQAARWAEKVRYVSPTLPMVPPRIAEATLECVQRALLETRQLEVRYRGAGNREAKKVTLHPLGLLQRGPVTYLVATAFSYEDVRLYALHRIEHAELALEAAKRPEGFSLDDYVAAGGGHFASADGGKAIRLEARVEPDLASVLEETPLSEDMALRVRNGEHRVRATVPDTWQLRWWILSQGPRMEVLRPKGLRSQIAGQLAAAAQQYAPAIPRFTPPKRRRTKRRRR